MLTIKCPPSTPTEPLTEVIHGVEISDPYRWLEDQDSSRTRAWLGEQVAYSRSYIDALPGRHKIRKRVQQLLGVESISPPLRAGDRYFFSKRASHQEQPTITMREGISGHDIDLIDPTTRGEGNGTAVGILAISSDGRYLAYCVTRGGRDSLAVEILDVDRKAILPDRLPEGFHGGLVFSCDGTGFYYSHIATVSRCVPCRAIYWHTFGTPLSDDVVTFSGGEDPRVRLRLTATSDRSHMWISRMVVDQVLTTDIYLQDLASDDGVPRLIAERMEGKFYPFLSYKRIVALTNWQAPRGRIVSIDLAHPERDKWVDIVPESTACLSECVVCLDYIFLGYTKNATTRIEIVDSVGHPRGKIDYDAYGTAHLLHGDPNSNEAFYAYTSFSEPTAIYSYDAASGQKAIWSKQDIPLEGTSIEVDQIFFTSKDGTQVPMFLASKGGAHRSKSLPTFLTGYGGFGASITPQFTAYGSLLMECGCLLAIANIRGGAEFGEEWHEAAKRQKRQCAIDDFIAATEWLLTQGRAIAGRIAIGGGSNAGLLVGAALTQRPELFCAVVCLGPLLDMLRYHKFDQASTWIEEYGCADNEDDFPFLHAYSPYHHVESGAGYPAVLLISGDADTRCNPLHARKMAARLQAATSSSRPILLDYKLTWGHRAVQPLSNRIAALTDRLSFICNELGVSV
jgi:prolyl oligopeptidase